MNLETILSEEVEPPSKQLKEIFIPSIINVGLSRKSFYKTYFPEATTKEINDWHWQLKNRVTTLEQLSKFLNLSSKEKNAFHIAGHKLPIAITPHYLSLINKFDPDQPLRKSIVPTDQEFVFGPGEASDPLQEDGYSPVYGLVHRYPDRVLFLITNYCSVYCRYCTRSRLVGEKEIFSNNRNNWQKAINYIREHREVRDVLLSGGDPLTLDDNSLEWILSELRSIPHVEMIRIGTKTPTVLPQRITPSLCKMLKKYHPLYISVHFTHPDELVEETAKACMRLADSGIPLGSQTVLLAGINDNVETMKRLMHGLLRVRVRPYYIFQCDPITGSAHFRTPISKGIEIIEGLRGHTSGYAVPSYVIDAPGGGGKIPLLPEYYKGRDGDDIILRNYENKCFKYHDIS